MVIPSILSLVGAFKSGEHTAAAALESLRVHYVVPLVKADGTVDRKAADFLEVRKQCEAALIADFAATTRTGSTYRLFGGLGPSTSKWSGGFRIEPGSDLHKRIPDLFALSKGAMKKLSKVDPDWIVATAVKNAVRRDWNRIVKACLPKSAAQVGEDGAGDAADVAPGAGTKASEKATSPVATTPEAVLAAIQNCAASMPDASSLAVFIQSVATVAKRLESDRKAGRAILPCEA